MFGHKMLTSTLAGVHRFVEGDTRAAEQETQYIRAKLIEAEQSGFVTPDRHAFLAEIKARKKP
jgi:hypothetical protein